MKKNVLHLIPSFHQGGSERQAIQLAGMLRVDAAYNVTIACLDKSGALLEDDTINEFGEIAEFPLTSFYDLNAVRQQRRFVEHLRAANIDILQTHDFYTNIFGMFGARIARVPVRIAAKRETGMRSRLQKFVERRAFGMADTVVVNSKGVRDHLTGSGVPPDKLELIYNGTIQKRFDVPDSDCQRLRESFGLPNGQETRIVTIVANLREPVKNHEMFVRGALLVSRVVPETIFVIAGEGERVSLITELVRRLGISDRVRFLGRCTRVPELLAASDICVLTSDSEGFSNSILEYMAAGRPVVATDVGGASEAIVHNETGFLVPANDDKAFAERLIELLNDPQRMDDLGRAGKRRAEKHFTVESQLAATIALYERELGSV